MEKVITTIGSLTVMAIFSPINGVTNPRIIRPMVIPSQNPVDVILLENGAACRTSFMNVTTHPPKATSIPTYPRRKIEQIQLTRAAGILNRIFRSPPFSTSYSGCCFLESRNEAPVESQKHATQTTSSIAAPPI